MNDRFILWEFLGEGKRKFILCSNCDMIFYMETHEPDLLNRITINPKVLAGKPTIRGFRISVEQILNALAAGVPHRDLLADFPELESEDIYAALTYAAKMLGETRVYPVAV